MSTKPWMVVSKNKHANGFIQIAYFFSRTTESSPKSFINEYGSAHLFVSPI